MRGQPLAKQQWASKHMSGHFAHGKNMVQWQRHSSATCPRCRTAPEDKLHICRCTQDEVTLKWTKAVAALMQWMKDKQSDPNLIWALTQGLQAWHSGYTCFSQTISAWVGCGAGWLAIGGVVSTTRDILVDMAKEKVKQAVDYQIDQKTLEHYLGHVGTS